MLCRRMRSGDSARVLLLTRNVHLCEVKLHSVGQAEKEEGKMGEGGEDEERCAVDEILTLPIMYCNLYVSRVFFAFRPAQEACDNCACN